MNVKDFKSNHVKFTNIDEEYQLTYNVSRYGFHDIAVFLNIGLNHLENGLIESPFKSIL